MKKETERENMRELTRAELEIMQILWDEKNAFVNDILERMPEPKPAYNTVSTDRAHPRKERRRRARSPRKKPPLLPAVRARSLHAKPDAGSRPQFLRQLVRPNGLVFLRKGTLAGRRVRKNPANRAGSHRPNKKTNRVTRNRTAHPDPTVPQP